MEKTIIKDYGQTIAPEAYMETLQGHQYIPQADQVIRNIAKKFYHTNGNGSRVLDLGCGPGRLTRSIKASLILGLDISETFIKHARLNESGIVHFGCADFTQEIRSVENWNSGKKQHFALEKSFFDVIIMQGVMHHIHGNDRAIFLQKSFDLLKPDGILVIGDEFIKDYQNEDERRVLVCKFYLHIIDEARKGGFNRLAEEEAKNLIDDVLSGKKGAGFANEEIIHKIFDSAKLNNNSFYNSGYIANQNTSGHLIPWLERECGMLATDEAKSFNRGDLKVSTRIFTEELMDHGFALKAKYEIGPVEQLGGMAVMVFKKR